MRTYEAGTYDVAVVGAGHAGCEAALACARMGQTTLLLTLQMESIAMMACNPAVGGTSKGHLVREGDALGGEMGLNTDATALQIRLLNLSKGPAVHSLRAQADKLAYQLRMRGVLESTPGLSLRQGEVVRLLEEGGKVAGVVTATGGVYRARAVVLCSGVYLGSRVIIGQWSQAAGPSGLFGANALTRALLDKGVAMRRFKTGTPCRVDGRTVDLDAMERQDGDPSAPAFSFLTDRLDCPQWPCYLTWTNEATHALIRANLDRSPLYRGDIQGTGTRYCPSIEDKVVRFQDKPRHQVFLEPEGRHTREMYVQGMSSSLPEEVQAAMLRTLPGLERVQVTRTGYAIEYDCIDSMQLTPALMLRALPGFFLAGQVNGTSGYEEAAAQGILAGINAALYGQGEAPFHLGRDEAYAGVLVDDLITKGASEPYRMMTSRAEYRLLLRQDNADLRLTERSYRLGLASRTRYERMLQKREQAARLAEHYKATVLQPTPALQAALARVGETPAEGPVALAALLRRPAVALRDLEGLDTGAPEATEEARRQAEILVKYEGYIARQEQEVARFHRLEDQELPKDLDYDNLEGLRLEARAKLSAQRPRSLGQASRILGVSPADIAVLIAHLKRKRGK